MSKVAAAGAEADRAPFAGELQRALLRVARESILHGLRTGRPLPVDPDAWPPALRAPGAAFVTLRKHGALRGCVGELEPRRPLVESVAHHAWAAAFRDPRFAPLAGDELEAIELHVSALGPLEPIAADGIEALVALLRPGQDGLVLADGPCRATFLPAVWESLADPHAFVCELLAKAGISGWSPTTRAWRYTAYETGGMADGAGSGSTPAATAARPFRS